MSELARGGEGSEHDRAPLVEALVRVAEVVKAPFFFPGHQMGRGFPRVFVDNLLAGPASTCVSVFLSFGLSLVTYSLWLQRFRVYTSRFCIQVLGFDVEV